jgi:Zn finger protein HypA/HybF involved in hydrogenase expression
MKPEHARKVAEEMELPAIDPHDHPDNQVIYWSPSEIRAIDRIRRETVATALVKLTQGEPEMVECNSCRGASVRGFKRGVLCPECQGAGYALPIPSQQAECPHGVDDGACKECYNQQAAQPAPQAQPKQVPLPKSYQAGTVSTEGPTRVALYFSDQQEAETWFESLEAANGLKGEAS